VKNVWLSLHTEAAGGPQRLVSNWIAEARISPKAAGTAFAGADNSASAKTAQAHATRT
jgi:hypothetical protein